MDQHNISALVESDLVSFWAGSRSHQNDWRYDAIQADGPDCLTCFRIDVEHFEDNTVTSSNTCGKSSAVGGRDCAAGVATLLEHFL
ncbi:hypothetical protein [Muricoccus aerilatus]|uniref:hypothetical protein n=1 Tax=Muricoccus aerilatus TaxID=452982 RepID=UPI0012EC47D6|nr:hypothetical protein [Roseomonas aerilata]